MHNDVRDFLLALLVSVDSELPPVRVQSALPPVSAIHTSSSTHKALPVLLLRLLHCLLTFTIPPLSPTLFLPVL